VGDNSEAGGGEDPELLQAMDEVWGLQVSVKMTCKMYANPQIWLRLNYGHMMIMIINHIYNL
jgi:hypothetical protein